MNPIISANKIDIMRALSLDEIQFEHEIREPARDILEREYGTTVHVSGLLAFNSHCGNDCSYCGLRRSNTAIPRYRLDVDAITNVIDRFSESGVNRIFFVSGEDRSYPIEDICTTVTYAHTHGLHVTLGCGEYDLDALQQFHDAGTDCFTLKFETSDRNVFRSAKPTSDFDHRMRCIRSIKEAGMELGSGDIIGLTGQSLESIADDILLMHELGIDWAPVVPYIPAPGTPMAKNTPMGDVALTLRVLAILRLLMPRLLITAGQPSQGSNIGFADPEGNRAALDAGANLLFVDMTPQAVRKDFDITPGRILPGVAHVDRLLGESGRVRT